jgi:hypothetical protein
LVRLAGIEPTTPWFVAKYSIQLSYSRQASNYATFLGFVKGNRKIVGKCLVGVPAGFRKAGIEPA